MIGKRIYAAVLAGVMVFSLASCANKDDADDNSIYGRITSIEGNDVVIAVAKYSEEAASDAEGDDDSKGEDDSTGSGQSGKRSRPQNGNMPEGFDPSQFSGKMPEGFDGSLPDGFDPSQFKGRGSDESGSGRRQMPENFDPSQFGGNMPEGFDGSLPDGFDPSQLGNMPGGFDPSQFDGSFPDSFDGSLPDDFDPSQFGNMPGGWSGGSKSGGSGQTINGENGSYTLTGEEKELRIPVGVTVVTSAGVKSGFEALSSGDIVKVTVEKGSDGSEVVTEVQIMEQ